jgi:hypothetical protein
MELDINALITRAHAPDIPADRFHRHDAPRRHLDLRSRGLRRLLRRAGKDSSPAFPVVPYQQPHTSPHALLRSLYATMRKLCPTWEEWQAAVDLSPVAGQEADSA